jgi:glycosyltransferase involved in cell wall biosynthesis
MTTAAIVYARDGFDTGGQRLLGRQAAGEGFLKALVRNASNTHFHCQTETRPEFDDFVTRIRPWAAGREIQATWLRWNDRELLERVGALHRPDSLIANMAWQRRFGNQRGYAITGVTHTIASLHVQRELVQMAVAPVQPWDALICTSNSVRSTVERILANYQDYLEVRTGARSSVPLKLPVIPLGVDCAEFDHPHKAEHRAALRTELGVGPDDLLVLYVGRLVFYAKAHPAPLYLAVERAAAELQRTRGARVHLVQAGWFEGDEEKQDFLSSAAALCPSARCLFVDGRKPGLRSRLYAASDIFVSLADNIQETFGLTPVEAMASGVPVVVSDWDGYRETVRDGVDGFRVATTLPPPGAGTDFALGFSAEALSYSHYVAHTSLTTAVDVRHAAACLERLAREPELRAKLGEAGKQRARELYDWPVVVRAYEALWSELTELRSSAPEVAPLGPTAPADPRAEDPYRLHGHYPTRVLSGDMVLARTGISDAAALTLRNHPITSFGHAARAPAELIDRVLAELAPEPARVIDILTRHPEIPQPILARTLVYLLKLDLLRVMEPDASV